MNPNPALKKLGFAETDRVAIIHTDDIGMSHGSYAAATDLWKVGVISSSAVMVPCGWFAKTAAFCRAMPNVDMGVHLTLTCEWDGYRWGPISTRDAASGLMDSEGFFPRTSQAVQQSANVDAARLELFAQVQRAIDAGIVPTHADTHMGTVFHPKFMPAYIEVAKHFGIPVLLLRYDEAEMRARGWDADAAAWMANALREAESDGLPLIDHIFGMPLDKPENRLEQVFAAIDALQPGITHFLMHPSHDTPEARAIGPDMPSRIGDFETFMDERVGDHLRKAGVHIIGYRELRKLLK